MRWIVLLLLLFAPAPQPVRMGPGMEVTRPATSPGDPLFVTGTVRRADGAPAAGVSFSAWQTNAQGRYGPDRQHECCYLQATVTTDQAGRYALRTIVPGSYGGNPPHIHFDFHDGVEQEILIDGRPRRLVHDFVLGRSGA
jgi:protocatechuate 3,4-dioxygenase beta subunit